MSEIAGLLIALLLILLNAFFVSAEFAFVKVRPSQLDTLIAKGSKWAAIAKGCVVNIDPYLSATQLGITLASLGLGWTAEPVVEKLLEPLLHAMGIPGPSSTTIAATTGFVILSFMHIVVGEVAPKSLAIAKPETISLIVAPPMRLFYFAFYPALVVLNASSNFLLKLIHVEPVRGHNMAVSADELRQITLDSTISGLITENQGELIKNVFRFSNRVTHEIMVPRNRMVALDVSLPVDDLLKELLEFGEGGQIHWRRRHTRYPLYEGRLDNIIGILHIKDLIPLFYGKNQLDFRQLARPAYFVPETMSAQRLLSEFQQRQTHMAVVVDEYGSVAGIVTLEDTLEELVGEIQDEFDRERPAIEEISGGYSVDSSYLVEDLCELLQIEPIESEADTINGFLMEQLGRLPQVGDIVRVPPWEIRVASMEKHRVDRVHILKLNTKAIEEDSA